MNVHGHNKDCRMCARALHEERVVKMKRRNLSKVTALFLTLALCIGLTGSALAASFQDVPKDSTYVAALTELADKGLVKGTGKDAFHPDRAITLAELVTFLGRIAGATADQTAVPEGAVKDGWSNGYLAWAITNGLTDGKLGQYSALTAAQVDAILASCCTLLKIDAVKLGTASAQVKRGELVTALAALAKADFTRLTTVSYTTVTQGEDWGPAVSKVILDIGTELKKDSVSKDSFAVTSTRVVQGIDFATFTPTPAAPVTLPRAITAAYLCDKDGKAADTGSHVAIEMVFGPNNAESAPFAMDFGTMLNDYIDMSHAISMKPGTSLTAKDGKAITMEPSTVCAASVTLVADEFDITGKFAYAEGDKKIDLTYASWMPKTAAKGTTPLVIWLHGMGEGGTDPRITLLGNKVVNLATDDVQKYFGKTGAAVLTPQSPTMWMDYTGKGTNNTAEPAVSQGKSYYTEALMALIKDYVAKTPNIDTSRIYIGGCSNGGYMTMNMLVTYPGYFAAGYPICTPYDKTWITAERLAAIKTTPIWFTAAKTDSVVTIYEGEANPMNPMLYTVKKDASGKNIPIDNNTNAIYDALIKAGAKNVHYTLFEKVEDQTGLYFQADGKTPYEYSGHFSWVHTLNNECIEKIGGKDVTVFDWLSQQKLAK